MRILLTALFAVCLAAQDEQAPQPLESARRVTVSYYAAKYNGRRTSSGQRFSNKKLTAAHLTLPLGTHVRLTNPANQKSVEVVINDRGPHIKDRDISITRRAARELGILRAGTGQMEMEVLP